MKMLYEKTRSLNVFRMAFYSVLLILLSGCSATEIYPRHINIAITDSRVPRFCFVRPNLSMSCHRTLDLCRERQFEEFMMNHLPVRRSCMLFRLERNIMQNY